MIAVALGAASLLTLARLLRWRGLATLAEPLLSVLHLAYLWLPVGLALAALNAFFPGSLGLAAVHALTAGAMGTMTLAVMSRATLGHTGRPLSISRAATTPS